MSNTIQYNIIQQNTTEYDDYDYDLLKYCPKYEHYQPETDVCMVAYVLRQLDLEKIGASGGARQPTRFAAGTAIFNRER